MSLATEYPLHGERVGDNARLFDLVLYGDRPATPRAGHRCPGARRRAGGGAMSATSGSTDTRVAQSWQGFAARHRAALVVTLGVAAALAVVVLLGGGIQTGTPLDPDNPGPDGAQALARVLDDQGVDVTVARDAEALEATARGRRHHRRRHLDRAPRQGDRQSPARPHPRRSPGRWWIRGLGWSTRSEPPSRRPLSRRTTGGRRSAPIPCSLTSGSRSTGRSHTRETVLPRRGRFAGRGERGRHAVRAVGGAHQRPDPPRRQRRGRRPPARPARPAGLVRPHPRRPPAGDAGQPRDPAPPLDRTRPLAGRDRRHRTRRVARPAGSGRSPPNRCRSWSGRSRPRGPADGSTARPATDPTRPRR